MAEALVSFVLDQLGTVNLDEIKQEVRVVAGVKGEIKKLTNTFTAIQELLKDADHRQFQEPLVKLWLEEFKDVAHDMEDVLDEWTTEMQIKSSQITGIENAPNNVGKKKVHSVFCSLFSCFREVCLRHDIGSRIQKIRERADLIANEKDKYQLVKTKSNDEGPERLQTSSLIDESVVCGRNLEKDTIISKLLGESSSGASSQQETGLSHPIVISIVGMGGLGKTALAQLVINNERVKNHFDKTMWVCVSDPFDRTRIAQAIIKTAGGTDQNSPEWNELHNSLSKSVTGKRFLLVLDDVWNDDPVKWESLELALNSGAHGSRILVTTRNEEVAKIMNSNYIYDLKILSDNDCWYLISRIAFVGRDKEELETLNPIGFEIAKKCKGLPLAAKALGSLLRFRSKENDWENVLKSEIWEIEEVENNFLKPALLLSYFDLPSPLKPCFTYCSIFPKDYEMEKDVLIKSWMAHGFLNSRGRITEDLEMIGEEYFNNLVSRSFFEDIEFEHGNKSGCKMHDLVHDFAQFLMKNEIYVRQMDDTCKPNNNSKIRHFSSIHNNQESSFDSWIYDAKNLRTFQLLRTSRSNGIPHASELPPSFFSTFSRLRVLCVQNSGLKSLSREIGTLVHLRYLDLQNNYLMEELPESITTLYNLQALNLEDCRSLCKLPKEMWKMNNLRHLNFEHCDHLKYLPQGIGKLTSLRTLTHFPLNGETQGPSKIEELKDLNHLKGDLKISGLCGVKTENEASEARLKNKNNLRVLELDFTGIEYRDRNSLMVVDRMNGVLEGLAPPPKLEKLAIVKYLGSKFPSWIADISILSHLKILKLFCCINCIEFPTLGRLPSLEELVIVTMNKIKQIGHESYGPSAGTCGGGVVMNGYKLFPKLKRLHLDMMENLEKLGNEVAEEEGVELMPCLVDLDISACPKLKSLPRKLLNLKVLEYHYSPSLSQFPYLPKLKSLCISGWSSDGVARLPQGLLAQLKALTKLEIVDFPELMCVPEEVKHLTSLEELRIFRCERLVQRCRKDEGEDWSIISHIPNIFIDEEMIH